MNPTKMMTLLAIGMFSLMLESVAFNFAHNWLVNLGIGLLAGTAIGIHLGNSTFRAVTREDQT